MNDLEQPEHTYTNVRARRRIAYNHKRKMWTYFTMDVSGKFAEIANDDLPKTKAGAFAWLECRW